MNKNQDQISGEYKLGLQEPIEDICREGPTFSKLTHFVRVLVSNQATQVLDSVDTFMDIDFEALMLSGKTTIILDIDECVAEHHGEIIPKNLSRIIQLHELGWKVIINSNMKKNNRYNQLEEIGIAIFTSKFAKPHKKNFVDCLNEVGSTPQESIMIGDNFLTDGGAIMAGIDFIKVKPILSSQSQMNFTRRVQMSVRKLVDNKAIKRGHINQ